MPETANVSESTESATLSEKADHATMPESKHTCFRVWSGKTNQNTSIKKLVKLLASIELLIKVLVLLLQRFSKIKIKSRKDKDVSPFLLVPLSMHWDGSFHTY